MRTSLSLTGWGRLLLLAAVVGLGACQREVENIDPEGPVVPPTPYALALPGMFPPTAAQPADNPLTMEGVALGRRLFYEKALSLDSRVSCGSCHRPELAFTDGQARSFGVNGARTPRSSMSLANMLWENKLTWDGAASTLEEQARIPLENPVEMHLPLRTGVARLQALAAYPPLFRKAFGTSTITEELTLKALAQFERTLISGNSPFDRYRRGDRTALSDSAVRGLVLFNTHPDGRNRGGNCADCHGGPLQTNREFSNNGLDATLTDRGLGAVTGLATDNGKFRVPSLRNIALTAPYMHDGRFSTLRQVLDHYSEHVQRNSPNIDPLILNATNDPNQLSRTLDLTVAEKKQIIAFLRSLTDESFITDPRFAPPGP